MNYRHRVNGAELDLPAGKAVCVGRNYAAHAKELNNPIPKEPVLFIKPNTALVTLGEQVLIPTRLGECHIETEICILVGEKITRGFDQAQIEASIAGVGVALDLTLRGLQQQEAQQQQVERRRERGRRAEAERDVDGEDVVRVLQVLMPRHIRAVEHQLCREGDGADQRPDRGHRGHEHGDLAIGVGEEQRVRNAGQ